MWALLTKLIGETKHLQNNPRQNLIPQVGSMYSLSPYPLEPFFTYTVSIHLCNQSVGRKGRQACHGRVGTLQEREWWSSHCPRICLSRRAAQCQNQLPGKRVLMANVQDSLVCACSAMDDDDTVLLKALYMHLTTLSSTLPFK